MRFAVIMMSVLMLAGCGGALEPPTNAQVCWRVAAGADGKPTFAVVSTGVHNLETCAANLEAVAMREKKADLTGAYQGQFLFITPELVQSSLHLGGARYRVFDAVTREKIDRDLRWMLDDEKHPSAFGPKGAAGGQK